MTPTDQNSPKVSSNKAQTAHPIPRQNEIDEHPRSPTVPVGVSWTMCVLVSVCGTYALLQISRPENNWSATVIYGAIVLASLTIAGGVLTPFDLRFDRLLRIIKRK